MDETQRERERERGGGGGGGRFKLNNCVHSSLHVY